MNGITSPTEPERGFWSPTDPEWFRFLRDHPAIAVVNFWRPRPRNFRAIPEKAPFLFKIRGRDVVGGFGRFSCYVELSILEAWDTFGISNGTPDRNGLRRLIAERRHEPVASTSWSSKIGCILLWPTVFFEDRDLIPRAADWKVQGAQAGGTFALDDGDGKRVWDMCELLTGSGAVLRVGPQPMVAEGATRGGEYLRESRPSQRIFRATLLSAYGGACAITNEHSLPVLDGAHILPHAEEGPDRVTNGLLIRTDLHRLFDEGYVTVTRDYHFEVGRALKDEFDNGRVYYALRDELHGKRIRLPAHRRDWPEPTALDWHSRERFKG